MTNMQKMQEFFFSIFDEIPEFLTSEPMIYFVSILIGIYVAGLLVTLCHIGNRR